MSSEKYQPPPGPPPGRQSQNPESYSQPPPGPPPGWTPNPTEEQYQPPSGPPPSWSHHSTNEQYQPPPGPPPGRAGKSTEEQYQPPSGPPPGWAARPAEEQYQPPPGPPPGSQTKQQEAQYAPPSGPPPAWSPPQYDQHYAPPPGPPPSHQPQTVTPSYQGSGETYAPPPGPPPSHGTAGLPDDPAPNYDWTIIPDTALLPPPPSIGYDASPTANASSDEGEYAYNWCRERPLWEPQQLTPEKAAAVSRGEITLVKPVEFSGEVKPEIGRPGTWRCRSNIKCRDSSLQAFPPLYSALADSPLNTGKSKTVYFELHVFGIADKGTTKQQPVPNLAPGPSTKDTTSQQKKSRWGFGKRNKDVPVPVPQQPPTFLNINNQDATEAGIALGFFAPPYPTWRLPGWQRGSLGVHGDDGHRYVNDPFGGLDFTDAFNVGDTLGIGITYSIPSGTPPYGLEGQVFFTRNGKKEGGWDIHEQLDEKIEDGVKGLEGDYDIFAAVGVFGPADFEIRFSPEQWLFNPY